MSSLRLISFYLGLLCFLPTVAQTNIDSLRNEINSGSDTNKLEIYYTLFWEFLYKDPTEAALLADSVFAIAKQMDYPTGEGMAHDAYMNIAILKADFESAKHHTRAQRAINLSIGNKFTNSAYHQSLGQIYYYQAEFDSAAYHFEKASEVYLALNYLDFHANMQVNVGSIYQQIGRLDVALTYFIDAEELLVNEFKDENVRFSVANNIAIILIELGRYEESTVYLQKAEEIANTLDAEVFKGLVNTSYGNYHLAMGSDSTALDYYSKSSAIHVAQGLPNGLNNFGISNVYFHRNETVEGQKFLDLALNEAREFSNDDLVIDVLIKRSELFWISSDVRAIDDLFEAESLLKTIGDWSNRMLYVYDKLALYSVDFSQSDLVKKYLLRQRSLADSLYEAQVDVKVLDLEKKYQHQAQELRITSLEKEQLKSQNRYVVILLASGVLLLIILLLVFYTKQRVKNLRINEEVLQVNLDKQVLKNELDLQKSKNLALLNLQHKQDNQNLLSKVKEEGKDSKLLKNVYSSAKLQSLSTGKWEEYIHVFSETHPRFKTKLKMEYPMLSPSDIKVCVLIKSEMSIKSIAQLLNISERGVYTSRYRIKKKINLDKDTSLETWLLGID